MLVWAPLLFALCFGSVGACTAVPPSLVALPVPAEARVLAAPPVPAEARALPSLQLPALLPAHPAAPAAADTTAPGVDAWFAEDKLRHFFMSFAATSLAYGAARTAGLGHGPAEVAAGASAAAAGVWKEIRDRRHGGPFSFRDLAWDGLGIAAALILAVRTR